MAGRGFSVNFKCPELQNVLQNIEKYNTKQAVKVEEAVKSSTKVIGAGAKQRVPVRTGNLKKSIRSSFDIRKIQGTVKAKAPHAHLVEFGAKAHPAKNIPKRTEKPYLRPAFENEKPALIKAITEAVKP